MPLILPTAGLSAADQPPGTPLIGYRNQVTTTNIAPSTEADGFPLINVANPATHLYWKSGSILTGGEIIDISGLSGTINYVGIAGHNFGSAGIGFYVETLGTSPIVPLLDANYLPVADDSPLIARFNPDTYGGLRIFLDTSSALAQMAVMYVGRLLVLERGIKVDVTHVPFTFGRRTRIVNGMSESGNFLGRIVLSESRASKAEFFGFTPTFYRQSVDPFLAAAEETPFFWSWAPTDYPNETGYSWLTADAEPEVSPDHRRIALTLEMAGIA
jgi:hypothetical protein